MPDDTTTEESTEAPTEAKVSNALETLSSAVDKKLPPGNYNGVVSPVEPDADNGDTSITEADTFPRSYVEELRAENKSWRLKAQQADTYAQRLHTELAKATGRLADPTDLPFNPDNLDDADKLTAAIDDLLQRKPHLASRTPSGDVGQGVTGVNRPSVDLAAILRGNTR